MKIVLASLLSAILTAALVFFVVPRESSESAGEVSAATMAETAYDRVMRTKTIRCGYAVWEPGVIKDVNTGQMSGVVYDITQKLGEMLGLKIEYSYELDMATYLEDFKAGKYDVECAGGFSNAERGKFVAYSIPYAFAPTYPYVRADDDRFLGGVNAMNKEDVTIATMDGDYSVHYKNAYLSNAKANQLPASANFSDMMMNVITDKADIALFDAMSAKSILDNNPGKLKRLPFLLRSIPLNYSLPLGDVKLKAMLDTAISELVDSGYVNDVMIKYGMTNGLMLRAAPGYPFLEMSR